LYVWLCIRKTYKKYGLKAIFQGGEKNEVADVFFYGYANYEKGLGKQFLKLTSIKESLLSLKERTEKEAKTIILIHQGSDIEYHNYTSASPHAKIISQLLEGNQLSILMMCVDRQIAIKSKL